ncbi:hypothetical protein CEQ48_14645 [Vibrio tarriae]|uniref:5-methyltetrahydrofolate--homocysteine methyltransferase n=1 Tax=Vibrio tarriae TaxID=2014742 RepID=A0AAU8WJ16_9VIBR|nr:hypothetical protein [Vibrio tarriae]ASK55959.1 hypothetical protein CEQ48_14645 [Vibrio tarriae]
MKFSPMQKMQHMPIWLITLAAIGGCQEGSNSVDATQATKPGSGAVSAPVVEKKINMSRFAINEFNTNSIYVMDGSTLDTLAQFTIQNKPSGLKTSPDGRYALALQRNFDLVEIIDGGIYAEAHGDHFHVHSQPPVLLSSNYQGPKPTHYDLASSSVALFWDGNQTQNASFSVLTDATIANATQVARYTFDYPVHGTAQIFGDHVFTGIVDSTTPEPLPNKVVALELHGDHFHELSAATDLCPELHGSAQAKTYLGFGCDDGVMIVNNPDTTPQFTKLPNPASLEVDTRIGTVIGFPSADQLLFVTSKLQAFYLSQGQLKEVTWKSSADERSLAYYATQDKLIIVSSTGALKVFNAATNFTQIHSIKLWDTVPTLANGQRIQLAEDKRTGNIIVTNPANSTLLEVTVSSTPSIKEHQLSFVPGSITWLGTTKEDHQH